MTRQHFEAIAQAIRDEQTAVTVREDVRKAIASGIATALARFNGAFDRARFMKACGF